VGCGACVRRADLQRALFRTSSALTLPSRPPPTATTARPSLQAKTHCDIKLKSFDAKNKIKVIKEVRGVTSLGLKEAKDLVEAAPCIILAKVKVEEAAKIIEKLKAEVRWGKGGRGRRRGAVPSTGQPPALVQPAPLSPTLAQTGGDFVIE